MLDSARPKHNDNFFIWYVYQQTLVVLDQCLLRIIGEHVAIRDERKPTLNSSIKKTQQIDFSININFWIFRWNFVKQPECENQSLTVQFNFSLIQNWLKTEAKNVSRTFLSNVSK
jgi:hypothetical protein